MAQLCFLGRKAGSFPKQWLKIEPKKPKLPFNPLPFNPLTHYPLNLCWDSLLQAEMFFCSSIHSNLLMKHYFQMRYVAAYLLATLGGNKSPSASDIKDILSSVGIDVDSERLDVVIKELSGKDINEVGLWVM